MFVLNPKSILRNTVFVDEELKKYLMIHGYSPISRKDSQWVFIKSLDVDQLIDEYKSKNRG